MMPYIHHINPIILPLFGPLAIRWYGLAYLLGFIGCILLLKHWAKKGEFEVAPKEVSNFVVSLALFGVFIGGRLGYVLFYGLDPFLSDPIYLIQVWKGGMASHGGFIGVLLFMLWYARKYQHSFWNLADNMACTASLGFAFGRLANFINGELWGRLTHSSWGVIFPLEKGLEYGSYTQEQIQPLIASGELQPRHPSQLYQAAAEGFLVFGLMLLLRRTPWAKREGFLSASYFILYALARIAMEFFREPDAEQALFFGWLTKGQLLSLFMILGAAIVLWKKQCFSRAQTL
jgi:phosphatidylglycerol---prolipoprotein diacylglyceryl transferase